MKKTFTKIFISAFVLSFFSLGLNFVFSGNLTTVDDPTKCNEILNYSANGYSNNSANGSKYTTDSNNVLKRYINKTLAITIAAQGNSFDLGICKNDYVDGSNAEKTPRKLDLCDSDIIKLIGHQESLFKKYVEIKNPSLSNRGFVGHEKVWGLQNLMSQSDIKCHTKKDCKLGVNTASDFLFCQVCSSINTDWKELKSLKPEKTCESGYVLTDDKLCCQKTATICLKPEIRINDQLDKNTYTEEEGDLEVVVDYSVNTIGNIKFPDLDKVVITPNSALSSSILTDTGSKTITFSLSTTGVDKININIDNGCALLDAISCPSVEIELEREIECQLTKDRAQCTNKSSFGISDEAMFTGFASLLAEGVSCEKGTLIIPFCPDKCTNRKFDNFTCEQTYGSGRYGTSQTPTCCKNCGTNRILVDDECECDTTKPCNRSGDKRNLNTCKCECDPSQRCCGILLNTVVPFIGDCIEMTSQNDVGSSNNDNTSTVNQLNAFPFLMMGLSKILVTAILIFSFLIVIVSGLMMVTGVYDEGNYKKGMERIKKVVVALILLGSSGLILKLINPSFFGG